MSSQVFIANMVLSARVLAANAFGDDGGGDGS